VRLPAPATGLRALSGRLTTASPVFVHLQPPLGPMVPDQCRLSIDPTFAYRSTRGESDHGSGLPMSSLRHSTVDLLAPFRVVSAYSDNPCAGLPKFPAIPLVCTQWHHLSSPVYSRRLFQAAAFVRSDQWLGTFHAAPRWSFAFWPEPHQVSPMGRTHCEVPSSCPTSLSTVQIHTPLASPAYTQAWRSFGTSSSRPIWNPPCLRWTPLMTRTPHPADCQPPLA